MVELGSGKELEILPGERLDDLRFAGLRLIQPTRGYRFSLDPVLLCAFAELKPGDRVADLGTGGGIIPLLLARRTAAAMIVGLERQAELADRARRSVRLNGLDDRVRIVTGDLREPQAALPVQGFDAVLANPPYRQGGSGRIAPLSERAAARHELAGGIEDFLGAASRLLGDGGRCCVIFLAERLAELLALMRERQLEPKRLRMVHGRLGDPARMVLVEGRKRGRPGLWVGPPLLVYEGQGYSSEVRAIYGEEEA